VLTYGLTLRFALPGISYRQSLISSLASAASSYIAPGGAAVGAGVSFVMLRTAGFRPPTITLALGIVLALSQVATLCFPLVAIVLLWLTGDRNPLLERVAQVGLVVLVIVVILAAAGLWSERAARWAGDASAAVASRAMRIIRRGPVEWSGAELAHFRSEALDILRTRWHLLTIGTLAGHLTVYLVLVVCLWGVGVSADEVSLAESFAAWAITRLIGSLPITPGGIGIVEVGLTASLVGFGGNNAEVLAAVLLYRFATVVVPLVVGGLASLLWRREHPGEALEAEEAGPV
jgi:uncharacterized protein (TIRG00374 family)